MPLVISVFLQLCEAKRFWRRGQEDIAQSTLLQAKEQVSAALERSPHRPTDLGNLGYIEFLLGELDDARTHLTQAIKLGGEAIRQDELEDTKIHTLSQDQGFRELVTSITVTQPESS